MSLRSVATVVSLVIAIVGATWGVSVLYHSRADAATVSRLGDRISNLETEQKVTSVQLGYISDQLREVARAMHEGGSRVVLLPKPDPERLRLRPSYERREAAAEESK